MRYDEHENLTSSARHKPEGWRLAFGITLGVGVYFVLGILYFQIAGFLFGMDWVSTALIDGSVTIVSTIFLLGTFITMLAAAIAAARLHDRTLADLLGGYVRTLRTFMQSARALLPIFGIMTILIFQTTDWSLNTPPVLWVMILPISLILVLIQVSAEEIVFRGYLQSQFAALNLPAFLWIGIPSILFGAVHYDPVSLGDSAIYVVMWAVFFGLLAADLTARTGTLGPAIAIHFVNNLTPLLLFGYPDYLSGLSLFHLPYGMDERGLSFSVLIADGLVVMIMYLAIRIRLKV